MSSLALAAGHDDTVLVLTSALDVGSYPAPFTLDAENISIVGGDATSAVSVVRGQNGTALASHPAGTSLVPGWGAGADPAALASLLAPYFVGIVQETP